MVEAGFIVKFLLKDQNVAWCDYMTSCVMQGQGRAPSLSLYKVPHPPLVAFIHIGNIIYCVILYYNKVVELEVTKIIEKLELFFFFF